MRLTADEALTLLDTGVYVLHAYIKKSNEGATTPKRTIDTVMERYNAAVALDGQEKAALLAANRYEPSTPSKRKKE